MQIPDGYTDIPDHKLVTVVTSLEMLARPEVEPAAAGGDWRLERRERPDLDAYLALYREIGEEWLWWSRLVMPRDALERILHDPKVTVDVMTAGGQACGLLELDYRTEGQCEVAFFGVTAAMIGTGAGRWLMQRGLEQAWAEPIGRLWVHTCTLDHPGALPFYRRMGFTPYHRQIEVVDDPRLNGILARDAAQHFPCLGGEAGP